MKDDCTLEDFTSMRHQLAWTSHTSPFIFASVIMLSKLTAKILKPKHMKGAKAVIRRLRNNSKRRLIGHNLYRDTFRIVAFADASYANNSYSTSHLGYMVLLTNQTGCVLGNINESYKSKLTVRSVLRWETDAFSDPLDAFSCESIIWSEYCIEN